MEVATCARKVHALQVHPLPKADTVASLFGVTHPSLQADTVGLCPWSHPPSLQADTMGPLSLVLGRRTDSVPNLFLGKMRFSSS